jgi:hypothetical protein
MLHNVHAGEASTPLPQALENKAMIGIRHLISRLSAIRRKAWGISAFSPGLGVRLRLKGKKFRSGRFAPLFCGRSALLHTSEGNNRRNQNSRFSLRHDTKGLHSPDRRLATARGWHVLVIVYG